jgi:hypothetical protein
VRATTARLEDRLAAAEQRAGAIDGLAVGLAGLQPRVDTIDLAPTVPARLGVARPDADGRPVPWLAMEGTPTTAVHQA